MGIGQPAGWGSGDHAGNTRRNQIDQNVKALLCLFLHLPETTLEHRQFCGVVVRHLIGSLYQTIYAVFVGNIQDRAGIAAHGDMVKCSWLTNLHNSVRDQGFAQKIPDILVFYAFVSASHADAARSVQHSVHTLG